MEFGIFIFFMSSLLIKDATLVTSANTEKVDVLIRDGLIDQLAFHDSPSYALPSVSDDPVHEVVEAEGMLLFPGLIDNHVHFREPGLTHKATMKSEAAAAVAGGVTTVCEMPNTIPPTVTVAALADKIRRASEVTECDIRFFFGVTEEIHLATLREILAGGNAELERLRSRLAGVKIYLDHSTGNQKIADELIGDVFKTCAEHGFPLVAHCEDPQLNKEAAEKYKDDESITPTVARHSFMRPAQAEAKAIEYAIGMAKEHGTPLHIAHLSTSEGIELVRRAKADGISVTCEVAPHHLFFTTDDYKRLGTLVKMNPPIRTVDHVEALWKGIEDGTVDCIATDHAPHTLEEKTETEPLKAPSGVPGVETMLSLLLTVAGGGNPRSDESITYYVVRIMDIFKLCFENPNRIFGLGKTGIVEGAAANMVLVDPHAQWTIEGKNLHSLCKWTPYENWQVTGRVVRIFYAY
ncbi:MAG: dihydroorotase [Candidatus Peribacteria bacterium]|nr:dihydroorotase [Candidatus Peribacteria bacterium]